MDHNFHAIRHSILTAGLNGPDQDHSVVIHLLGRTLPDGLRFGVGVWSLHRPLSISTADGREINRPDKADSRRWLNHGKEVETSVYESDDADDRSAHVKEGVVAEIQLAPRLSHDSPA